MTPGQIEAAARHISADLGLAFEGHVGAGAFKDTFRVLDVDGTLYALKIYRPGFPAERTKREIDAMQRCCHPGIARLKALADVRFEGNVVLYSLEEYIAGGTLTGRLAKGLLSANETAGLGSQLIDAVEHIASQSLVHRDLKPDNIMFREDGSTAVIVNFGIVRDLANSSLTGSWLLSGPGTPFFSPPEQLRNEKALIDWRSDQFSLGVVLTLCCVGFHPYAEAGISDVETVQRVAERWQQADRFKASVRKLGLPSLIGMTAPWSIERLRTPRQLADAWAAQRRSA